MKRFVSALLIAALILLSPAAFASDETDGKCGENLTWTLEGYTLTISGTGDMYDYTDQYHTPWSDKGKEIGAIIIEDGVTSIGDNAFAAVNNFHFGINIPESVTRLGKNALTGNIGIVEYPDGMTYIGTSFKKVNFESYNNCFYLGDYLLETKYGEKAVKLKPTTTLIARNAIAMGVESVTLPEKVRYIAPGALARAKSVTVLEGNPYYKTDENGAVYSVENGELIFCPRDFKGVYTPPEGVTRIGAYAFSDCAELTGVRLDNVTEIGECAFYRCTALESVAIPGAVRSVSSEAFSQCVSLKNVEIGDGVRRIESRAFTQCNSLKKIIIPASVGYIGHGAFFSSVVTDITIEDPYCTIAEAGGAEYTLNTAGGGTVHARACSTARLAAAKSFLRFDATGDAQLPFGDVDGQAFYAPAVCWATENNVTSGISDTQFAPGSSCTRAQVVTFLWRAAGCPEPLSTEHPFTDVNERAYYYKAMLWAVETGVTKGVTETQFVPNAACTRAQIVTFLWRANGAPVIGGEQPMLRDVAFSSYCYRAMLWAVNGGVTAGVSRYEFAPNGVCTRGQVVTFLMRAERGLL